MAKKKSKRSKKKVVVRTVVKTVVVEKRTPLPSNPADAGQNLANKFGKIWGW